MFRLQVGILLMCKKYCYQIQEKQFKEGSGEINKMSYCKYSRKACSISLYSETVVAK